MRSIVERRHCDDNAAGCPPGGAQQDSGFTGHGLGPVGWSERRAAVAPGPKISRYERPRAVRRSRPDAPSPTRHAPRVCHHASRGARKASSGRWEDPRERAYGLVSGGFSRLTLPARYSVAGLPPLRVVTLPVSTSSPGVPVIFRWKLRGSR